MNRALGIDTYRPDNPYALGHVIGEVDKSPAGNTILRIGTINKAQVPTWQGQLAHVVLSPAERETLIAALIAQREDENAARVRVLAEVEQEMNRTEDSGEDWGPDGPAFADYAADVRDRLAYIIEGGNERGRFEAPA